jgi:hypothetical protein
MIMNQPVGVRLFPDAHRLADARHLNAAVAEVFGAVGNA